MYSVTHPIKSEIVIVYIPPERFEANEPVPPVGDHEYKYGEDPPVTFKLTKASAPPLQLTLVCPL